MLQILKNVLSLSKYRIPVPSFTLPEVTGPILVLAPHFDDDIIGCGGTLYKYNKQGKTIYVAYLTDGTGGRPEEVPAGDISRLRYEEAKRALEVLGIPSEKCFCLGIRDGSVSECSDGGKVRDAIARIKPGLIFTPYIMDIHPDHRGANYLLANYLENFGQECPEVREILMYEVWTPLIPNVGVNITDIMDKKLEALRQHQSQLKMMRYIEMVSALNLYRASYIPHERFKYVEAFYRCPVGEYKELVTQALGLDVSIS